MLFVPVCDDSPRYQMQWATFGLIAVNLLIHIYASCLEPIDRVNFWISFASLGEGWNPLRAISAGFLHAGWLHLIGNMWFLFLFGGAVEGKLGYKWTLGLYGVCLLLSDISQHVFAPEFGLLLGASGAVGGLAGAYWFLFCRSRIQFFYWLFFWIGTMSLSVNWAMIYLFGWDMVMFFAGEESAIAHSAHVGGLVSGMVLGLLLRHFGYAALDGEDMLSRFVIWRGRRKRARLQGQQGVAPLPVDPAHTHSAGTQQTAPNPAQPVDASGSASDPESGDTSNPQTNESKTLPFE